MTAFKLFLFRSACFTLLPQIIRERNVTSWVIWPYRDEISRAYLHAYFKL